MATYEKNTDGTITGTVQTGDTLSEMTQEVTGHGSYSAYTQVANDNNISNPNLIYPDQKINFNDGTLPGSTSNNSTTTGSTSTGDTTTDGSSSSNSSIDDGNHTLENSPTKSRNEIYERTSSLNDPNGKTYDLSNKTTASSSTSSLSSSSGSSKGTNLDYDYDAVIEYCQGSACQGGMTDLCYDLIQLCSELEACQDNFHCKGGNDANAVIQIYKDFSSIVGSSNGYDVSTGSGLAKINQYAAALVDTCYGEAVDDKERLENAGNMASEL